MAPASTSWHATSGADLIHAYVLGVETECRSALSVFPEHYDRGWHTTVAAGVFGFAGRPPRCPMPARLRAARFPTPTEAHDRILLHNLQPNTDKKHDPQKIRD